MSRSFTSSFVLVLVCLALLVPRALCAQSEQPAAGAPSPAPSPHAAPTNAPVIGALGDFGGARTALANAGVTFRGHYLAEFAANPIGGLRGGTAYASELMLGSDVDLGTLESKGLGTIHFTFTAREGSSLSSNAIGNILTVQEIYGSGLTPRLTELSYDQPLAAGTIDLSFGRLITENDFAASPTYWGGTSLYCSYQSNAICGTPIAVPVNSGYDAYPQSTWGFRVKGNATPNWTIEAGAYQVNPLYGNRGAGFDAGFGGTTGTYLPFETDLTQRDAQSRAVGSIRLGGYYDTSDVAGVESDVTRFVTPATTLPPAIAAPFVRGRYGYWIQADHLLGGGAGPNDRGTALFAAYEYGDPRTALISEFFDAGLVQHGTFAGRPHDTLALGYAYANFNPNLRAFETSLDAAGYTVPISGQEQIAELNYGIAVNPWLTFRPGLQYVFRPSGNSAIPGALVIDLQTSISF